VRVAVLAMGSRGDVEPFLAVAALAAGTPPIPRERLTDTRLADALTDALRRRHGARRIAQALAAEDGIVAAVELLEALL
jgi:UDP:flavonoid glycosyltransferase YjiC (YdhE family)